MLRFWRDILSGMGQIGAEGKEPPRGTERADGGMTHHNKLAFNF